MGHWIGKRNGDRPAVIRYRKLLKKWAGLADTKAAPPQQKRVYRSSPLHCKAYFPYAARGGNDRSDLWGVCYALLTPGLAGTQATQTPNSDAPGATDTPTHDDKTPDAGQNSLTEAQATELFNKAGYAELKNLKLNEQGLWEASSMKDGKTVMLTLDAEGKVSEHMM